MSDSTDDNAWNFYGSMTDNPAPAVNPVQAYLTLLPGGRPLIPLDPVKDAWMKDYTGFITAYQHEMHCLGAIKHVLLALKEGRIFDSGIEEHVHGHNDHCIEVIRHALSCHPDLSLEVEWFSEEGEHTPFWGGMRHMCRDRDMLHNFLRERNLGFKQVEENGELVTKAWAWGLPGKKFA
ncbi:hypothetical protein BCR34DRAFT_594386 [Clohesyomyces aquaticus]|uniref:Uncharacterized protein n=1 Tax=Clohesyomyces aquaticus TaxID=1231657 RepID=A0A1Y1Y9A7_9PLEO|nr:hypothetical protein BCR34DRAFT_594386 [Clohesyomyces aquaticus]